MLFKTNYNEMIKLSADIYGIGIILHKNTSVIKLMCFNGYIQIYSRRSSSHNKRLQYITLGGIQYGRSFLNKHE